MMLNPARRINENIIYIYVFQKFDVFNCVEAGVRANDDALQYCKKLLDSVMGGQLSRFCWLLKGILQINLTFL